MRRLLFVPSVFAAVLLTIGPAAAQRPTTRAAAEAAAVAADARLAPLEKALAAAPDDLRAGNDYRRAVVETRQYDRAIAFFEDLLTKHPGAGNAQLNFGFAYVDKIPDAGAITRVILANNALTQFSKALEIERSWIGLYTRGNSYLFWPKIFGRTSLGIADLEEALRMQTAGPRRHYHVRVYIALGDGYWMMDEADKARATWAAGLAMFPDNTILKSRLETNGEALASLINGSYDPARRVDTSLEDLWTDR
jgi:tetratricopeptide (TPR) repeat protein